MIACACANRAGDAQFSTLVTIGIETATVFASVIGFTPAGAGRSSHASQAAMAGVTQGALVRFANPDWGFLGTVQSGGTFTGIWCTSFDATGTWTDAHAGLPAMWLSGTNHIGRFFVAQPDVAFGPGAYAIFASGGVTPGVDTSHLGLIDPVSGWSDITPSLCTNSIITGFCYDPVNALWGLLVWNGTTSTLYTSSDHTTWHANFSVASRLDGLTTVGNVWAMNIAPAGIFNSTLLVSTTVASAHAAATTSNWSRAAGGSLITDGVVGIASTLSTSGNSIALWTGVDVQLSRSCGMVEAL
jgi:hypothetical protein